MHVYPKVICFLSKEGVDPVVPVATSRRFGCCCACVRLGLFQPDLGTRRKDRVAIDKIPSTTSECEWEKLLPGYSVCKLQEVGRLATASFAMASISHVTLRKRRQSVTPSEDASSSAHPITRMQSVAKPGDSDVACSCSDGPSDKITHSLMIFPPHRYAADKTDPEILSTTAASRA